MKIQSLTARLLDSLQDDNFSDYDRLLVVRDFSEQVIKLDTSNFCRGETTETMLLADLLLDLLRSTHLNLLLLYHETIDNELNNTVRDLEYELLSKITSLKGK